MTGWPFECFDSPKNVSLSSGYLGVTSKSLRLSLRGVDHLILPNACTGFALKGFAAIYLSAISALSFYLEQSWAIYPPYSGTFDEVEAFLDTFLEPSTSSSLLAFWGFAWPRDRSYCHHLLHLHYCRQLYLQILEVWWLVFSNLQRSHRFPLPNSRRYPLFGRHCWLGF